ncbi:zf-HC2 domain-containing protein [Corynebacterium capitovis]|uniref:zf-HC2 domain-containing protein n=1 Tax=Corynebacterium capitovis TaxID=131081 RepID=UPI000686F38E|nr:zf-HC2 domain-containing protein [Corynebacterium capitovis]
MSTEAVAAFADGELSDSAAHRARAHIVVCDECWREVNIQRAAAERLRQGSQGDSVRAPESLLQRLNEVAAQAQCAADVRRRSNWRRG